MCASARNVNIPPTPTQKLTYAHGLLWHVAPKTCKRQFCRGFQWPPEWHYMFSRVSLCKNHHLLGFHRSMLGKSEPKIFSQVVVGERWSWIPTAQSFTYHLKQIQESCAKKKSPGSFEQVVKQRAESVHTSVVSQGVFCPQSQRISCWHWQWAWKWRCGTIGVL